jgi:glycolate oxidase FAD binding subunit
MCYNIRDSRLHGPKVLAYRQPYWLVFHVEEQSLMGEFEEYIATLREHAPGAAVLTDADVLLQYTLDGVQPRAVIIPATVEETARAVALARHYRLTLLPRGGGTHRGLGGIAERIDLVIELTQLTRLLEHEAADLTCHTEAGITLAALQSKLASRGQRLALDPPHAEQATIGGILATNASGPRRLRYGSARDLVIGLRTIQASGEIARSGGRVVKNVAGYDLNKLYIGSLGTLGIIVEAHFKLHPLPAAERTLLLMFPAVTDAMQMVVTALGSLLTPSAIELLNPGAAHAISAASGLSLPANGYTLAFNFEGSVSAVHRQLDETRLLARKYGALMADDLEDEAQHLFWEAVRAQTSGQLTCKATMLVTRIAAYMQTLEQVCRRYDLEAATVAHAGNGIVYLELRPLNATARQVRAITELRQQAQEGKGSLVVERCPLDLKRLIDVWGPAGSDFPLMRRLKQQFDPEGIFARGRFVGGL